MNDALRRLAERFVAARRPVVFTGAGVSTESGIPDFRSPGGLWKRFAHAWIEARDEVPAGPRCGGIVKPTTVLFGESMPAAQLQDAEHRSRAADLFVVLGSSLVVYPAAHMPAHAQHAGATLAIVNLEPTSLDPQADLVIREKAGAVMAAVLAEVRARTRPAAEPVQRDRALGHHSVP